MRCYDARRKLSALLDGAVEGVLRDALTAHVDACGACRADLDALAGTDRVVRKAVGLAAVAAPPPSYFEEFWSRLSSRLYAERREEDAMSMSTGSDDRRRVEERRPPLGATPAASADGSASRADAGSGSGSGAGAGTSENTGLHDIRKLAQQSIERQRTRRTTESDALDEAILESASPAALGQVVLPAPGREVAPPAIQAAAAAPASGALEPAAPARSRAGLVVAGIGLLAAAAAAVFFVTRGGDQGQGAATGRPQVAAASPAGDGERAAPPSPPAETTAKKTPVAVPLDADPGATATAPGGAKTAVGATVAARTEDARPREAKPEKGDPREETKPKRGEEKPAGGATATKEPEKQPEEKLSPADTKPTEPSKPRDEIDEILNASSKPQEKKPAAETTPGTALPEKLSAEDVRAGMGKAKARIQACYDKYKITGTIELRVRIEPDGTVGSAEAIDDKFANTETGLCVEQAVKAVKFPAFSGAPLTLKYKFVLR